MELKDWYYKPGNRQERESQPQRQASACGEIDARVVGKQTLSLGAAAGRESEKEKEKRKSTTEITEDTEKEREYISDI